jgi:hypothetical protein
VLQRAKMRELRQSSLKPHRRRQPQPSCCYSSR